MSKRLLPSQTPLGCLGGRKSAAPLNQGNNTEGSLAGGIWSIQDSVGEARSHCSPYWNVTLPLPQVLPGSDTSRVRCQVHPSPPPSIRYYEPAGSDLHPIQHKGQSQGSQEATAGKSSSPPASGTMRYAIVDLEDLVLIIGPVR